jgi:hypothetical protein
MQIFDPHVQVCALQHEADRILFLNDGVFQYEWSDLGNEQNDPQFVFYQNVKWDDLHETSVLHSLEYELDPRLVVYLAYLCK